jgi:hypothetical protein
MGHAKHKRYATETDRRTAGGACRRRQRRAPTGSRIGSGATACLSGICCDTRCQDGSRLTALLLRLILPFLLLLLLFLVPLLLLLLLFTPGRRRADLRLE